MQDAGYLMLDVWREVKESLGDLEQLGMKTDFKMVIGSYSKPVA